MENNDGLQDYQSFVDGILRKHNEFRHFVMHGAPKLALCQELCEAAQNWAHRISKLGRLCYSELPGVGENITQFPADMTAEKVIEHWYSEHNKYEYELPGWQEGTNYFTQIVWKSTKEIGVGRAKVVPKIRYRSSTSLRDETCAAPFTQQQMVVVVFYRPSGNNNRSGQYFLNVGRRLPQATEIPIDENRGPHISSRAADSDENKNGHTNF